MFLWMWTITLMIQETWMEGRQVIGYSCNLAEKDVQFGEVSLLKVQPCQNVSDQYKTSTVARAQIIQRIKTEEIEVINCKATFTVVAIYCGWDGFTSRNWNGIEERSDIPVRITKTQCAESFLTNRMRIFDDGEFGSQKRTLTFQLEPDGTSTGIKYLQGSEEAATSTCTGREFKFNDKDFKSHVLKLKYKIIRKKGTGTLNHERQKLKLNSELATTRLQEGEVFDTAFGNFYFPPIYLGNTSTKEYAEVLRGSMELYMPNNGTLAQSIAIIIPSNRLEKQQIAVLLGEELQLCIVHKCSKAFTTHLQGIYVIIIRTGEGFHQIPEVNGEAVNMFLDIKASLGTVYLSQEVQLAGSFHRIATTLCQQSRNSIMTNMEEYALQAVGKPRGRKGKFLLKSGSMAYVVSCAERIVELRTNLSACYEGIPIQYKLNNSSVQTPAYLDPITYNIVPESKTTECSTILPVKFGILTPEGNEEWICFSPQPMTFPQCRPPQELNPMYVGRLYKANAMTIRAELYSKEQIKSIQNKQWEGVREEVLERNMEKLAFEGGKGKGEYKNIRRLITGVVIEASERIQAHILPWFIQVLMWAWEYVACLMVLSFVLKALNSTLSTLGRAKKIYKETSISWRLLGAITSGLFMIILPEKRCVCKCQTEEFAECIRKQIREAEREELLHQIYNTC